MTKKRSPPPLPSGSGTEASSLSTASQQALVFISHDSRDADLAEEFDNLLRDASGGMLRSFRSSDKKGASGMEYGEEWYSAIMNKLGSATDVVALLTPYSIDRPWILYEAGVAKGKIGGKVLGLVVGAEFRKASAGPFYQFQNCPDEEEAITGLVAQLIKRNPSAEPRTEAIKLQVRAFRERVSNLLKKRSAPGVSVPHAKVDESSLAKLFEEIKVMFRDLPQKVGDTMRETAGRRRSSRRNRIHPMMVEELFMDPALRGNPARESTAWLMLGSAFAEELPLLHTICMEMYRASITNNHYTMIAARSSARNALRAFSDSKTFHFIMREEDPESRMLLHHVSEMLDHVLQEFERNDNFMSRRSRTKKHTGDESS